MSAHIERLNSLDSFSDHVINTFFDMSCEKSTNPAEGGFTGSVQVREMSKLGLVDIGCGPVDVFRRKEHISQVEQSQYLIKFQIEGEALIRQRGQEAHLRPGDFVLCSNTEPYELHFAKQYRQLVLAVPQLALSEVVREPDAYLGKRMDANIGANGLLSQFVQSLGPMLDKMDPILISKLENNVFDLLATALEHGQTNPRLSGENDGVKTEHLFRIKAFIRKNLGDSRLCPDWIAKAHDMSTRYLHMLFNDENTSVSRFIQLQRLEACRACLADTNMNSYTITEIAFRWGFNDASHFNRVFKAAYNVTPRQYRVHGVSLM